MKHFVVSLCCLWIISSTTVCGSAENENSGNSSHPPIEEPLQLVNILWPYVQQPLVMVSFLVFVGIVMIGYHHTGAIADYFPETCVLFLIGLAFGAIFWATKSLGDIVLGDREFMLFMLPPIVLDASYQLNNKGFTSNVGTILLYAVVGTLINFFFIGGCLYGLSLVGATSYEYSVIDAFLFSSFIIAVDPVAVIAIFKTVGVNDQLYYMVFGESLFNDAVTIVVFELMRSFTFETGIEGKDIGMAVAAFLVHSFGAVAIGFAVGLLTAVVSRFTKHMRIAEPAMVYVMAYWCYLLNELLGWSGIIGLAVCCLTQTQLVFQNLSKDSLTTLTTGASVLAVIVEATVFLFLGVQVFKISAAKEGVDWLFCLWVVILCLLGRLMTVFGLNAVANPLRKSKIPLKEQFIMWWAGLRGALAFALACTLHHQYQYRYQYITATIVYITFTLFVMGTTIRPLVKFFKIEMKELVVPPVKADMNENTTVVEKSKLADEETSEKPGLITASLTSAMKVLKRNLSQPQDLGKNIIKVASNGHVNDAFVADELDPIPDYDIEEAKEHIPNGKPKHADRNFIATEAKDTIEKGMVSNTSTHWLIGDDMPPIGS